RWVGKANGSRECAPDDRLRVPTNSQMVGTAQARLGPPYELPAMSYLQDELSRCLGEALVLIAVGHGGRLRFDLVAGISHGDGEAALAEHQNIVRHVADGCNLRRRNVV